MSMAAGDERASRANPGTVTGFPANGARNPVTVRGLRLLSQVLTVESLGDLSLLEVTIGVTRRTSRNAEPVLRLRGLLIVVHADSEVHGTIVVARSSGFETVPGFRSGRSALIILS